MDSLVEILSKCLVELLFQLDYSDNTLVNNDFAVSMMEIVGVEFQRLNEKEVNKLISVIIKISSTEIDSTRREFGKAFAENFGLIS